MEKIYELKCSRVELPKKIDDDYIKNRAINNKNSDSHSLEYSWSICGKDVSNIDMSELSIEEFKRLSFDSNTVFSEQQIAKFNPTELLEQGKFFSEDIMNIHNDGIDGTGINVGIIDTEFDINNDEFKNDKGESRVLFTKKFYPEDYTCKYEGFHGKTVTSLLGGRSCGVAPNCNIHLFNSRDMWKQEERAEILKYIINSGIKLDLISMSATLEDTENVLAYKKELEEKGCTFIDSSVFWKDFSYGEKQDGELNIDPGLLELMSEVEKMPPKLRKITEKIPQNVIIPCANRTNIQVGDNGYMYNGVGCASWAIPQVAGLFALSKQLNHNISYQEFTEIARNTAIINTAGYRTINLNGLIKEVELQEKTNSDTSINIEKADSHIKKTFLSELASLVNNDQDSKTVLSPKSEKSKSNQDFII